jgi:hypothetical protein
MNYHALISRLASAMLLVSLSLAFTSCDYKDLCYDHHHLVSFRVLFDWSNVPDAQPEGMTVLFYNLDEPGTNPTRFDLPGREGGVVKLAPGHYRAVAYNYDTEAILLRNTEDWNNLTAYTRGSSIEEGTMLSRGPIPRAAGTDSEPVILEPDMLYACAGDPFTLEVTDDYTTYDDNIEGAGGIASRTLYTITLTPNQRVRRVNIYVTNVQNLSYSTQFGGALSTLSPSVVLANGQLGEPPVSQAYTLSQTGDAELEAHFNIFGHCPNLSDGATNSHIVTIYAVLGDGTKWYYTVDVTEQLHDPVKNPDEYNLNIYIDGLPVPKPIVNGAGFVPTLDGWDEHVYEVGN